jgi:diacylglycerol kinase
MSNKKTFSLKSRLNSFTYAFSGLKMFLQTEHNSWIHIVSAVGAIIIGKLLSLTNCEWCILIIAIGLVIASEIFNTAIELLTDMISPNYNDTAKKVKDMSAAAVLISSITALVVGLFIFLPKLYIYCCS